MILGGPFQHKPFYNSMTLVFSSPELPSRAALPTDRIAVNWHSLPLSVKKLQQSCVNTMCLLTPILFIIFALKETVSLRPPGDPLVVVKDILG